MLEVRNPEFLPVVLPLLKRILHKRSGTNSCDSCTLKVMLAVLIALDKEESREGKENFCPFFTEELNDFEHLILLLEFFKSVNT